MADKIKKAHGHIIQADWNQTDPLQMDYIHNKPKIPTLDHLASLEDLDKQQIKIVNRSGKVYTSQIRVRDLNWIADVNHPDTGEMLTWGCDYAPVELPKEANDSTVYTINIYNVPASIDYSASYPAGIGVCTPIELMKPGQSYDGYYSEATGDFMGAGDWREPNTHKACLYCDGTRFEPITFKNVTWTGPWAVLCGESSGEYWGLYEEFKDSIIEYSFINEESDEVALGPVHDIDLHSNTEVHYDFPVTELTINNLVVNNPKYSHEWTISFIAGDEAPIITMPNTTSINKINTQTGDIITTDVPIKWLYAEPVFEANHRYLITFKQIIDTIYGVWTVLE